MYFIAPIVPDAGPSLHERSRRFQSRLRYFDLPIPPSIREQTRTRGSMARGIETTALSKRRGVRGLSDLRIGYEMQGRLQLASKWRSDGRNDTVAVI